MTGPFPAATAALERLTAALDPGEFPTTLTTSPGRPPRLAVANRHAWQSPGPSYCNCKRNITATASATLARVCTIRAMRLQLQLQLPAVPGAGDG